MIFCPNEERSIVRKTAFEKQVCKKTRLPCATIFLALDVRHKGIETTTNFAVKNTSAWESNN